MIFQPQEIFNKLSAQQEFLRWKENHTQAFLSHFFCWLNKEGKEKVPWELGFFDPQDQKITSFVYQYLQEREGSQAEVFIKKNADAVFKKDDEVVEELPLQEVKLSFLQAREINFKEFPLLFPGEISGEGFVLLQPKQKKAYWSFSLLSKSLAFLHLRIDASTGEVVDHQRIEVVQQSQGGAKEAKK